LVTIQFIVNATAVPGSSALNLAASSNAPPALTYVNEGHLTLIPAPTNAADDEVDGVLTVVPPTSRHPCDVNGDGSVTWEDAQILVDELNAGGSRPLPAEPPPTPPYLDPSGDLLLSPMDVLLVINDINTFGSRSVSKLPVIPGEPTQYAALAGSRAEGEALDLFASFLATPPDADLPVHAGRPSAMPYGSQPQGSSTSAAHSAGQDLAPRITEAWRPRHLTPTGWAAASGDRQSTPGGDLDVAWYDPLDLEDTLSDLAGAVAEGWHETQL
jgi:hypothetical protein